MIVIPIVDILLLVVNIFIAVLNRGTFWGWLSTAFVIWQVWVLIKFVKNGRDID